MIKVFAWVFIFLIRLRFPVNKSVDGIDILISISNVITSKTS